MIYPDIVLLRAAGPLYLATTPSLVRLKETAFDPIQVHAPLRGQTLQPAVLSEIIQRSDRDQLQRPGEEPHGAAYGVAPALTPSAVSSAALRSQSSYLGTQEPQVTALKISPYQRHRRNKLPGEVLVFRR